MCHRLFILYYLFSLEIASLALRIDETTFDPSILKYESKGHIIVSCSNFQRDREYVDCQAK